MVNLQKDDYLFVQTYQVRVGLLPKNLGKAFVNENMTPRQIANKHGKGRFKI